MPIQVNFIFLCLFLLLGLVKREDLKKKLDIPVSGIGLAITMLHASLVVLLRQG